MVGQNQRRPFPLTWSTEAQWKPLHPSWSSDGSKMVFYEDDNTSPTSSVHRLVVFDLVKNERHQLTDGPCDEHPVWSPKGDWIAYTHYLRYDHSYAERRIWLIRPDGSEQRPMTDEKGKNIEGWWPSWKPGGEWVSSHSGGLKLISRSPAKTEWDKDPLPILGEHTPGTFMNHHWGVHGWLLTGGGNSRLLHADGGSARMLAEGGSFNDSDPHSERIRWGSTPSEIPVRSEK